MYHEAVIDGKTIFENGLDNLAIRLKWHSQNNSLGEAEETIVKIPETNMKVQQHREAKNKYICHDRFHGNYVAGNCQIFEVLNEVCITVEYDEATGKWQPLMYTPKASHVIEEPIAEGDESEDLHESTEVQPEMKMVGCANHGYEIAGYTKQAFDLKTNTEPEYADRIRFILRSD
jgi:hypothetical protein